MVRENLKLDSKNQFFNKWKKENWKDKLQNAYKSSSFHEKARFLSNCLKKWDFYVPRKKRIFCVIKLFCLQTHFPRFYGNQCSDSAAKDCFEMNVPLQTTFVRPFWPFFRHMYVHLSQNWGSAGHFEVLNRSYLWLVQNLWHKTLIFPFLFFLQFCTKTDVSIFCVFCIFVFFVIAFVPIKI